MSLPNGMEWKQFNEEWETTDLEGTSDHWFSYRKRTGTLLLETRNQETRIIESGCTREHAELIIRAIEAPETLFTTDALHDERRKMVEAVLRYEGFIDAEIAQATGELIHTEDCEFVPEVGWYCEEDGNSLHPLWDRAYEIDETLCVAFEALKDKQ